MGLDFSHCGAHWSYSGFYRFRERIARAIGLDYSSEIKWKDIDSPLVPFLDHSDCGGELSPADCRQVARALKAIVNDWPDDDYDKQEALELIRGMEIAAAENAPLEFT
jgi:hypothetical protein